MRCPRCGFDNPEGLKFCGECGTPLTAPCPRCGFANPPQFKFCGDCGASLIPPSRPSSTPMLASQSQPPSRYTPTYLAEKILTSKSALEGELKQVTVLFADLKDSTELIRGLDPEAAQQLLDPAIQRMMDAVHRYEGTVNQVMGDGIMALFGAPIAHEDHALRACYATLAMQAAMRRDADRVQIESGLPLQIRVGLHTGAVVRSIRTDDLHTDYVPIGHATGLAARLQRLAHPGSLVLSDSTFRLTEGFFAFALGAAQITGVSAPADHDCAGDDVGRSLSVLEGEPKQLRGLYDAVAIVEAPDDETRRCVRSGSAREQGSTRDPAGLRQGGISPQERVPWTRYSHPLRAPTTTRSVA
jgi:class 3 adenylate cyclase